jgi:hypothetical protein
MNNIFLHTLFFAVGIVFALVFPSGLQWERTIRFAMTRVVAGGTRIGRFQVVIFAVPYRPNRTYYRLAIVGIS